MQTSPRKDGAGRMVRAAQSPAAPTGFQAWGADGGSPLKPEFLRAISPEPAVPHALCLSTAPSCSSAPSPAMPSAPRRAVCSRKVLAKLVLLLLHIHISSQEEGGRTAPLEVDEGLEWMGDVSWPCSWLRGVRLLCREWTQRPTLKGTGAPQTLLSQPEKHPWAWLSVLCSVVSTGCSLWPIWVCAHLSSRT